MARPAVRRTLEVEAAAGYALPGLGRPERGLGLPPADPA